MFPRRGQFERRSCKPMVQSMNHTGMLNAAVGKHQLRLRRRRHLDLRVPHHLTQPSRLFTSVSLFRNSTNSPVTVPPRRLLIAAN